jgi:hypothetical protein
MTIFPSHLCPGHSVNLFWRLSTNFFCGSLLLEDYYISLGRAIAQAVSRWLLTAAVRVRSRVRSCGICGGQSRSGAGFLLVLRLPPAIFIPPNSPS